MKISARLRMNYNFHQSLEDKCHRFLNAVEPGTVVPIHRHPTKDESFVILRGKVRVTTHNDDGSILEDVVLSQESGNYGVDIPKNVWHKLESLESGSVIFECKAGPFVEHEVEGVLDLTIKKDKVAVFDLFLHRKGLDAPDLPLAKSLLQKELLSIYAFAKQYPNSGSVERLLGDVYEWFDRTKINDCNWMVLTAILVSIAKDNPRTYGIVAAIISLFVDRMVPEERMSLIKSVYDKVMQWPNSGLLQVWLQRITLKIDQGFMYNERLCKVVAGEEENLWNNNWLDSSIQAGFSTGLIVSRDVIENMKVTIAKSEVSPFYQSSGEEGEE